MLNLTNYQKAGYAMVFVETMEIKRAIKEQLDQFRSMNHLKRKYGVLFVD
jgi:hypothetical protein